MSQPSAQWVSVGGVADSARVAALAMCSLLRLLRGRRREDRLDRSLGLRTMELAARVDMTARAAETPVGGRFRDSCHFQSLPYAYLEDLASRLPLSPDDVFLDVGCGAGRAVCFMAQRGARRSVGVEVVASLAGLARENAAETVRRTGRAVEVIEGDAARLSPGIVDEATVVMLANPFGFRTLKAFVETLRESLRRRPRSLSIAYFVPLHRWYLDDLPWLRLDTPPDAPTHLALWRARPEEA